MIKCRSPRSLVWGIRNLLRFLVRSEYAISGRSDCMACCNKCIAVRKVATPLQELACHMGSHSLPATLQR